GNEGAWGLGNVLIFGGAECIYHGDDLPKGLGTRGGLLTHWTRRRSEPLRRRGRLLSLRIHLAELLVEWSGRDTHQAADLDRCDIAARHSLLNADLPAPQHRGDFAHRVADDPLAGVTLLTLDIAGASRCDRHEEPPLT